MSLQTTGEHGVKQETIVIHDAVVMIKVCHVMLMMWGCCNVFGMRIIKKNIKKKIKKNVNPAHIQVGVHKHP